MNADLTVCVCTHNRADVLRSCLDGLAAQATSRELDVLVVANACSDDTSDVAKAFLSGLPRLRLIEEARPGLSHARNRGLAETCAEYIAYIDDDAVPCEGWSEEIARPFADRRVACVGGRILIRPVGAMPDWVHPDLCRYLGEYDLGDQAREVEAVVGANFALRVETARDAGGFSDALGYCGEDRLPGEETELCRRLRGKGLRIEYCPSAGVYHTVDPARLNRSWFISRAFMGGRAEAVIDPDLVEREDWLRHAVYTQCLAWGHALRGEQQSAMRCLCHSARYYGLRSGRTTGAKRFLPGTFDRLGVFRSATWPGLKALLRMMASRQSAVDAGRQVERCEEPHS
jgi:glycosyltransferase involved in cell wall biosynthesis